MHRTSSQSQDRWGTHSGDSWTAKRHHHGASLLNHVTSWKQRLDTVPLPPPPPETFRLFLSPLVFHCPPVCPAFSLRPLSGPLDQSPAPSISGGGGPTCGDASVPPLTSARLRLSTSAGEDVPPSAPLVLLSAYLSTFISVPPPSRPSPPLLFSFPSFLPRRVFLFISASCLCCSRMKTCRILKAFRIFSQKTSQTCVRKRLAVSG